MLCLLVTTFSFSAHSTTTWQGEQLCWQYIGRTKEQLTPGDNISLQSFHFPFLSYSGNKTMINMALKIYSTGESCTSHFTPINSLIL